LTFAAPAAAAGALPVAGTTITVTTTTDTDVGGNVAGKCSLENAITESDTQTTQGSCAAAAGGPWTIDLGRAQIYALETVDNYWYGPNGLPAIAANITIVGNGSSIVRSAGGLTPAFRIFFVGADPTAATTPGYSTPAPAS
jgi:hypothetical protein